MKLQELLPVLADKQNEFKVHYAIGGEGRNPHIPLNEFLKGKFDEYQNYQTQRNFERTYILSLCYLSKDEWLFVGVYESFGIVGTNDTKDRYIYKTELTDIGKEFIGRLVVGFQKEFRQSYPNLETCLDAMEVVEIKREKMVVKFPGYDSVNVSWRELESLIKTPAWATALENQKAVYLIVDCKTGKKYVGSAYGADMILGRRQDYIKDMHGGNKQLKQLDLEYIKNNFKFSILEIFKSSVDDEIIINRESFWKDVLLTRGEFGYNDN